MKMPYGVKVTGIYHKDGKTYYCFRLRWWYALYTAIISCFSARWYVEHSTEENEEENGGNE